MLTPNDDTKQGGKIGYLRRPRQNIHMIDPILFNTLHHQVIIEEKRCVSKAIEGNIIPSATYFEAPYITNSESERMKYYIDCINTLRDSDIIFFDPDNGLEVDSCPKGSSGSSKYLYYDDLNNIYSAGYSIIVFQHHKPRQSHLYKQLFIKDRVDSIFSMVPNLSEVISIDAKSVVYFVLPQRISNYKICQTCDSIEALWNKQLFNNHFKRDIDHPPGNT